MERIKYPTAKPGTVLHKVIKKKYVTLTMSESHLGVDNKGDIYKVHEGVAVKLAK